MVSFIKLCMIHTESVCACENMHQKIFRISKPWACPTADNDSHPHMNAKHLENVYA